MLTMPRLRVVLLILSILSRQLVMQRSSKASSLAGDDRVCRSPIVYPRTAEYRLLDHLLGRVVQGAGRLIQKEERGLLQQRPDTGALRGQPVSGAVVLRRASFWADRRSI